MYKTSCILIKSKVINYFNYEFVPQRLTLNSKSLIYKGDSFLYFLNAFQKCYILTEFFYHFYVFHIFELKQSIRSDC